jgi:GrpB-like predicted nucleotidyltransferase (UPF0157 family)
VSQDWPAWATQPVEIVEPDPNWPGLASQLIVDLRVRLAPWLGGEVEHVGSTAVPNLPAKPILDLMAPIRSLDRAAESDTTLAEAGWELVPPELDQRRWRRFHVLPDGDRRFAHLQLVERTHPMTVEVLAFRDALRADAAAAAEYATLKRRLAATSADDREAYTRAKSTFVRSILDDHR